MLTLVDALKPQPLIDQSLDTWITKIEIWGNAELLTLGIQGGFSMYNPAVVAHIENFAGERIKDLINGTTRDALRSSLIEGIQRGEGTRQLRARITGVFTEGNLNIYKVRAERIARSEVTRSSNFAIHSAQKQSRVVQQRQWVAALINTRDTHKELHGQIRGIDEPFTVDLSSAMYPGDFGEPKEDVNCQCTTVAVINDVVRSVEQLDAHWKAYVAESEPWVQEGRLAFIRGFEQQLDALLAVFDRLA